MSLLVLVRETADSLRQISTIGRHTGKKNSQTTLQTADYTDVQKCNLCSSSDEKMNVRETEWQRRKLVFLQLGSGSCWCWGWVSSPSNQNNASSSYVLVNECEMLGLLSCFWKVRCKLSFVIILFSKWVQQIIVPNNLFNTVDDMTHVLQIYFTYNMKAINILRIMWN